MGADQDSSQWNPVEIDMYAVDRSNYHSQEAQFVGVYVPDAMSMAQDQIAHEIEAALVITSVAGVSRAVLKIANHYLPHWNPINQQLNSMNSFSNDNV